MLRLEKTWKKHTLQKKFEPQRERVWYSIDRACADSGARSHLNTFSSHFIVFFLDVAFWGLNFFAPYDNLYMSVRVFLRHLCTERRIGMVLF